MRQSQASTRERVRAARRQRHGVRDHLRTITGLDRIKACGLRAATVRGGVEVYITQDRHGGTTSASYSGVQTCGSVWACPCCAAVICEKRAEEINHAVRTWLDAGKAAAFVTLTLSHHAGERLAAVLDDLAASFSDMLTKKGHAGRALRTELRLAYSIRATEITHGENGWHPHAHVVLLFDQAAVPEDAARRILLEWQAAVAAAGRVAVFDAYDFQEVRSLGDLARYVAKVGDLGAAGGLAREMTAGHAKIGKREGSRTPFGIAADHKASPSPRDEALWGEYERTTRGRRRIVFSHGLRAAVGLASVTDEQLALDDDRTKVLLTIIGAGTWYHLSRAPGGTCGFLERVERGLPAAMDWLTALMALGPPELRRAGPVAA